MKFGLRTNEYSCIVRPLPPPPPPIDDDDDDDDAAADDDGDGDGGGTVRVKALDESMNLRK